VVSGEELRTPGAVGAETLEEPITDTTRAADNEHSTNVEKQSDRV
jgi:hypothetical protein